MVGESADFTIVVTNTGSSVAKNVVLSDNLPATLSTSAPLTYELGDLQPGESKTVTLSAATSAKGEYCNVASANGTNVAEVSDDACIVVVKPGLTIEKTGDEAQFAGKKADYQIVVTNTGDVDLTDLVVTDTPEAPMQIVKASGATVAGNTATWNIASLKAGQSKSFDLVVTSRQGTYCNNASVVDADLGLTASDDACTEWKGYPAVLLEVIDTVDPLLIGDKTTYVIRVTNQGTANDYNIKVDAVVPEQLKILGVSGATQGTHDTNSASFVAYGTLAPKEVIEYRIDVEAAVEGDARSKFELNTKLLGTPITEIEATQVY